ncbi:synaptotagmin-13 [Brienomyrus brachyistius]|uniref:synaptotagmin-13 n=1 Tax=Brienomyrus brachyistius TaxID=42636 RepID=UPI0020B4049F|nr:synaptotagmin-13 [Brienomyrus brachyistius]
MIFSTAVVLGATLGSLSGVFTLCWLSYLCKSCRKRHLEQDSELDPEKVTHSILQSVHQFIVKKSTESIQPRTLLRSPKLYKPKPSVTSPEVITYPSYTMETKERPLAETPASAWPESGNLATEGSEEVFLMPKQDSTNDTPSATELNPDLTKSSSVLHPKLHFSLTYNSERKELYVAIIETEHVAAGRGLEGYVLGRLHTPAELTEVRTVPRRLTEHVCWAESLAFPLPSGYKTEGEVALSLRSLDCFSQDVDLGDMRFKLADVAMMSDADCWVELQPPKQNISSSLGEILLSISYLPAANRLGVVVMKARDLQSHKLKDIINLSVKLTLKHQTTKLKKKQTRQVKHKMNPVWNEMMMLEVPLELLAKSSLELEVLNQVSPGTLDTLGHCHLGLQAQNTGLQHWQQMLDNPRKQLAMWHPLHA